MSLVVVLPSGWPWVAMIWSSRRVLCHSVWMSAKVRGVELHARRASSGWSFSCRSLNLISWMNWLCAQLSTLLFWTTSLIRRVEAGSILLSSTSTALAGPSLPPLRGRSSLPSATWHRFKTLWSTSSSKQIQRSISSSFLYRVEPSPMWPMAMPGRRDRSARWGWALWAYGQDHSRPHYTTGLEKTTLRLTSGRAPGQAPPSASKALPAAQPATPFPSPTAHGQDTGSTEGWNCSYRSIQFLYWYLQYPTQCPGETH